MNVPLKLAKKNCTAKYLPKRYKKHSRDNIMGITKPAIRRLARRGGVVRMQKAIYGTIRQVIVARLEKILEQIVHVLESTDSPGKARKTVTTQDVIYVLKRLGTTVYGFDGL
ncbi:uncharacterized protein GIQ15_02828 [Arthroderma uncinatum]|uniref:uncharacterized protein n=1 Tax=Arthroderma uncinatum TaxID=74035 RepID=UPI00144AA402|nr:uncharacterized protein GIQ15_02828 [Arthroderma uncinatum]KAF3483504.1 hypothetical protein GIQ15_02828 [Arthroderma uncinatum]